MHRIGYVHEREDGGRLIPPSRPILVSDASKRRVDHIHPTRLYEINLGAQAGVQVIMQVIIDHESGQEHDCLHMNEGYHKVFLPPYVPPLTVLFDMG